MGVDDVAAGVGRNVLGTVSSGEIARSVDPPIRDRVGGDVGKPVWTGEVGGGAILLASVLTIGAPDVRIPIRCEIRCPEISWTGVG